MNKEVINVKLSRPDGGFTTVLDLIQDDTIKKCLDGGEVTLIEMQRIEDEYFDAINYDATLLGIRLAEGRYCAVAAVSRLKAGETQQAIEFANQAAERWNNPSY